MLPIIIRLIITINVILYLIDKPINAFVEFKNYAVDERFTNYSLLKKILNNHYGLMERTSNSVSTLFETNIGLYITTSPKQRENVKKINNDLYVSNLGFSECLSGSPSKQVRKIKFSLLKNLNNQ